MKTVIRSIPSLMFAFLLVFSISSCGVKGPVKPPLSRSPSAATGLTARQIGDRLLISWNLPKTNQDGSPLELQGFEVFRNPFDPASGCPDCGMPEIPYRDIDLEYLRDVTRDGDRLLIEETSLTAGRGYFYRIVPVNTKGGEGASATIQTVFHPVPFPPRQPIATRETRGMRLRWSASAAETREAGFLGYNVYRHKKDQFRPMIPINKEYLIDTTFLDLQADPEEMASYTLRSVWRIGDQVLETSDSEPATATPAAN